MQKFGLFIFFLILRFSISYSQNYISYHKGIVYAEKNILQENYKEALFTLDSLFKRYEFVFAIDYFTAAQLATTLQQYDRAIDYLKDGASAGITKQLVEGNTILQTLSTQEVWKDYEDAYDTLRDEYLTSIDWELCEKLNKLFQVDLDMTNQLTEASNLKANFIDLKWRKQIKKNAYELLNIIQTYGFPGERLVGLDECDESFDAKKEPIVGRTVLLNAKMAFVMLMHYYRSPHDDINEVLLAEVKKGNMPPSQYAVIQDYLAEAFDPKYSPYQYYNQWRIELKKKEEKAINERRRAIGLGEYQHKIAKRSRWRDARAKRLEGKTIYIRP